ncbi:MBOAT family O-acyltransferase [Thalassotalea psychrophila]|uniref:Probable alginate O-acetylase n=1 Tax=Thalassotalea psychrophila TaxID=3065647 RepID=A0ABY9TQF8_9GAMM|nr:MBOAT family O-acyltransferase [Colwelliaceae bacterium SQ149]
MLFNSFSFIFFFLIVLALHNMPFSWRVKKSNLLIASYLFYAAWNPPFVILLWISTVVDWHVAKRMFNEQRPHARKVLLAISVIVNLGMLGFFKYGQFLLDNFIALMAVFGIEYQAAAWEIILPVGISFYTFQTMAYSLDVYLKRAAPAKSLLDFSLFVTFFPQLVAGPIVRPTYLIPQFAKPRVATINQLLWGIGLMIIGMFSKVVVADGLLAPAAEAVFASHEQLNPIDAWLGTLAFSGQIFCDFAGYSTIAIGVALTLGFSLPNNFNYPYAAIGFSDFWRRWHISLSSWLRDYLYIPLGGNKNGSRRTFINLMLTMLLGGLWHGAAWTFVVWGGLHGLYLAGERILRQKYQQVALWHTTQGKIILALVTYFLVNITWVFFRAPDFATAWRMMQSMLLFSGDKNVLSSQYIIQTIITISIMLGIHWYMRNRKLEQVINNISLPALSATGATLMFLIAISQGGSNAFIYFQF